MRESPAVTLSRFTTITPRIRTIEIRFDAWLDSDGLREVGDCWRVSDLAFHALPRLLYAL